MKWRVAYIKNEGSTRSYTLMQVMIRLLKWCNRKAIRLVPVHQADAVSRIGQILNTEWMLAMERLRPVFYKWGEPQIDMFATFSNRRLIKFVSPYPHPRAEWDGRDVHFLGQREGPLVRIPVTEAGPSGATEDLTVSWSANDSCGSIARNSSLVSGASGTIARRSDPTVHRRSTTANPRRHSARQRDGNPSLPAVKSTPMETLQPS